MIERGVVLDHVIDVDICGVIGPAHILRNAVLDKRGLVANRLLDGKEGVVHDGALGIKYLSWIAAMLSTCQC